MIEIKSRYDGRVLYVAKTARDVREALQEAVSTRAYLTRANLTGANLTRAYLTGAYLTRADLTRAYLTGAYLTGADLTGANLTGANLTGADLTGAYLTGADLTGANLTGANLTGAYLTGADLTGANLTGAYLTRADLTGADLTGAYLTRADLTRARGIVPERVNDLLMLLDQPGKIRAYKLVDRDLRSPIQSSGKLTYAIGSTISVDNADTNPLRDCAAGVNVATLPWVLRNWCPGYRVLVVEFEASDIAAIPVGDGKFRVHRCTVVEEKTIDPVALGLVKKEAA